MTISTDLVITGLDLPPYSARGLKQSIKPIDQASNLRRTINGALVDLTPDQFRKYGTTIQCTDQQTPAIDGVWPGTEITIHSIAELCVKTGASPLSLGRTAVAGSVRTEGEYTFYRPVLVCLVTSLTLDKDEWGVDVGWTLEAEEA